jgi:hypothetical protein
MYSAPSRCGFGNRDPESTEYFQANVTAKS